jgi:hypothetical protein
MIVAPEHEMTGWSFEATALFISNLFETFGFYKLYFEMIEFNYRTLASGAGSLFHVAGCLQHHEQHLGQRWHLYTLAIYRDEWHDTLARVAPDLADLPERSSPDAHTPEAHRTTLRVPDQALCHRLGDLPHRLKVRTPWRPSLEPPRHACRSVRPRPRSWPCRGSGDLNRHAIRKHVWSGLLNAIRSR